MKKKFQKVSLFFKLFHKFITIIIYILFKVKQQHTGEHMKPSRDEPVHDSPGNQAEKNQHRIAQEPGREEQVTIYFF
jgi:hypothetical protein